MKSVEKDFEKVFGYYYIMVSKPMIKIFGLEAALLLCNLYSEYRYWKTKKKLSTNNTFFSTIENVEHNTGLKKRQQQTAIKVLVEYGVLHKELHGIPPKRYFKFDERGIKKLRREIEFEIEKDKERKLNKIEDYSDGVLGFYEVDYIPESVKQTPNIDYSKITF